MIYQIIMMSGTKITVDSDDELRVFLDEANSGKKLILTKHGVANVASVDSIIPHKEKMEAVREMMRIGKTQEWAEEQERSVSPFAKLLSDRMSMSPRLRTAAQEEVARLERGHGLE